LIAAKKKSKGKNKAAEKWQKVTAQEIADTVDESWVTEHARQVSCEGAKVSINCFGGHRLPGVYQGACV